MSIRKLGTAMKGLSHFFGELSELGKNGTSQLTILKKWGHGHKSINPERSQRTKNGFEATLEGVRFQT
jgi:hypothetical protein